MSNEKVLACLIPLFLSLFFFSGCGDRVTITHFRGIAHTHPYHIQIGHLLSSKEKDEVTVLLHDLFEEIDDCYNHWNPYSEISQVNQLKIGEEFPISPELLDLIKKGRALTDFTDGRFNPTFGALIEAWKTALKRGELPNLIREAPIGWDFFSLENGRVKRLSEEVKLDLDGFLKGFTVDQILEKLFQKGYKNIYVEWGGDIRVSGSHPSRRPWRVKLSNVPSEVIALEGALATSGNEAQSYTIHGKRYSHILIPETRQPLPQLSSVTVQAPTCLLADALATTLMTFSTPKLAIEWLEKKRPLLKGVIVWIQGHEGEIEIWNSVRSKEKSFSSPLVA